MRLERSLAIYGLVDTPAHGPRPEQVDRLDFWDWRNIASGNLLCQERVERLLAVLNQRVLREALSVDVQILAQALVPSVGLQFTGLGRRAEYRWLYTGEIMVRNRWTCGWVEASYRQWLTAHTRGQLPARYAVMIPEHLGEWSP